jgi:hypothetical protein
MWTLPAIAMIVDNGYASIISARRKKLVWASACVVTNDMSLDQNDHYCASRLAIKAWKIRELVAGGTFCACLHCS